jgi:PmbA protein
MLNKDQAAGIFERVQRYSTSDEVEVLVYGGRSALTRFANNTIHQNVAEENVAISVRTAFGGRTARATSNKFDDESLRRVVQSSEALAQVQNPDDELLPMSDAGKSDHASVVPSRYFAETAAVTAQQRAGAVQKIVAIAHKHKLTTAGIFSTAEHVEGVFNSRGLIPRDGRRRTLRTSNISTQQPWRRSPPRRRLFPRDRAKFQQASTP